MIGLFAIFALMVLTGALVTVLASNAVHAGLGLVATLLSLAVIYVMMDAHFIAAVQVIVYAGAIMVLFLFVLMLLDATRPVKEKNPIPFVNEVAGVASSLIAGAMVFLVMQFKEPIPLEQAIPQLQAGAPEAIGINLFTKFLLPFEAVSIVLLVAVVGAVALVQRPQVRDQDLPEYKNALEGEKERSREVSGAVALNMDLNMDALEETTPNITPQRGLS
jgi:NADH-quinone oxidoreductase subunit J